MGSTTDSGAVKGEGATVRPEGGPVVVRADAPSADGKAASTNGRPDPQATADAEHESHGERVGAETAADHYEDELADGADESRIAPNYRYWRQEGGRWADEYEQRKKTFICYHIQELMLTEYVANHAPARVLEFGCGVGRHLKNLSWIPGIEVHGFDQSAAMVGGCLRWTSREWIDGHVKVGLPTGRLPYEDESFDLVYTSEVLVHVRPEDLPGILSELLRVSRRQVLHFEPSEHCPIVDNDHEGCWRHNLVAAYGKLGMRCEILTSGYPEHSPYRVFKADEAEPYAWSPLMISLYRRLASDMTEGIAGLRNEAGAAGALRTENAELRSALERQASAVAVAEQAGRDSAERAEALASQVESMRAEAERLSAERAKAVERCQQLERELREAVAQGAAEVERLGGEIQRVREEGESRVERVRAALEAEADMWKRNAEAVRRRLAGERARADTLAGRQQRIASQIESLCAHQV